jgi:hypothetical protein
MTACFCQSGHGLPSVLKNQNSITQGIEPYAIQPPNQMRPVFFAPFQVIPYLLRRAAENRSIMAGTRSDMQLLQMELSRRARAALGRA